MDIRYIKGDATQPVENGGGRRRVVPHIVNAEGQWGAGFVLALSKKWKEPEAAYRRWHQYGTIESIPFQQGRTHVVSIPSDPSIAVANMIAQSYCGHYCGMKPVRYQAIEECLLRLRERMSTSSWEFCSPRFGAGLGGGDWSVIEQIITRVFKDTNVPITIYDFKGN